MPVDVPMMKFMETTFFIAIATPPVLAWSRLSHRTPTSLLVDETDYLNGKHTVICTSSFARFSYSKCGSARFARSCHRGVVL